MMLRCGLALLLFAAATGARADDAAPSLGARLAGNTVNGVLFAPRGTLPRGGGELERLVFQAFLRPDGTALVREWDTRHDAYAATVAGHWRVEADTLCLDLPQPGVVGATCIEVHVWGPRIAGNGTGRFVMLDGDIAPGNALTAP